LKYDAVKRTVNDDKKDEIQKNIDTINLSINYEVLDALKKERESLAMSIADYENVVKLRDELTHIESTILTSISEKEDWELMSEKVKDYHKDFSKLVADTLNKNLEKVQINTFELQKNGEPKEIFEITMNGVPYKSLNSAGKIIAGIELIQLLNNSTNIQFPIIIDNKESITKNFSIKNQLITLKVVEGADLSIG